MLIWLTLCVHLLAPLAPARQLGVASPTVAAVANEALAITCGDADESEDDSLYASPLDDDDDDDDDQDSLPQSGGPSLLPPESRVPSQRAADVRPCSVPGSRLFRPPRQLRA